jgi:cytochrome P450
MTASPKELAENFDYTDPETVENLYAVFKELRDQSAATYSPKFGGHWAVTRYEDIVAIAKDTTGYTNTEGVTIPDVGNVVRSIPLEIDPPEHTVYRRFLMPRFRKSVIDQMEGNLRRMVVHCLNTAIEAGECDLVETLTVKVPAMAIADLLGLPDTDWDTFHEWTVAMQQTAYDEDEGANTRAAEALGGYLAGAIEARRGSPDDDGGVLYQLANGLVNDEQIPTDRALGMAILILMAGHDTTASGASSSLHFLADKPELRTQLAQDPELVDKFVEELLRIEAPVTGMSRTATCPHNVDGNDIAEGDKILLLWSSGNHDERVFPNPDEFDIDRNGRPNLAFGWGAHRCIGEFVARLELRVIIQEVIRMIPDYRLKDGFVVTHTPGIARGAQSLPVVFTPGVVEPIDSVGTLSASGSTV